MGLASDMDRQLEALPAHGSVAGTLLDRLPVGLFAYDSQLRIIYANITARSWFQSQASAVTLLEMIAVEKTTNDWQSILREHHRGAPMQRFNGHIHAAHSKQPRDLDITISSCNPTDGANSIGLITITDITAYQTDGFRSSTMERMAAIGQVAAKVAHELNNPLDGVKRYAGLTQRRLGPKADAKALEYLDRIQDGVRRMTAIVRDLLEFSRTHTDIDRPATVRALLDDAIQATDSAGVTVTLNIEASVSTAPVKNGDALLQVFCNLIKNANDAMNGNGQLSVTASSADRRLTIRFEDTGPGVGDEPDKLFAAFFTTKPNGSGTGLGLAVCREIIEARGGSITASNRASGGACFTIKLPAPTTLNDPTSERGATDDQ